MNRTANLKICILLFGSLSLSATAAAQNEVPNASFENWSGGELDFWSVNPDGGAPNAVPSSDAHDGSVAVEGTVSSDNPFPGFHTTMPFPITESYDYLVGYYKFEPHSEGDKVKISVSLWNDEPGNFSLKLGELVLDSPAEEWTQFIVPIPGDISGSTLVGSIGFLLVNDPRPPDGSFFVIDNLSLSIDQPSSLPPAPDLASPPDQSENLLVNPTLTWNTVGEAASYYLQVSTSASFGDLIVDQQGIADPEFMLACLPYNTTFFWRVKASGAAGSSAWSMSRKFTTTGVVPGLDTPANDADDMPLESTLRWHAVDGATSYHVQVATVADFSSPLIDANGIAELSYESSGLLSDTPYYWRVRASSPCDTGDWSDVRTFTTASSDATTYEITHETVDAFGWFGGDDRPSQGPRSVGVGQSVLVDHAMKVERFSFYFRGPFDYATVADGTSNTVSLVLNVRHETGTILKTLETVVPDSFTEGWVLWDGIDLNVPAGTSLIFTTYLVGAFDVLQVNAGQGADRNASYSGGVRFGKDGVGDADMEDWTGWSVHPFWDSAFILEGILSPPNPAGHLVQKVTIPGSPVGGLASAPAVGPTIDFASSFDFDSDGIPAMSFFFEDEEGNTSLAIVDAADYTVWRDSFREETPTIIGFYELDHSTPTKEIVIAVKRGRDYVNPGVIDAEGNQLSQWSDEDAVRLVTVADTDGDGREELIVFNPQFSQIEVWGGPLD